MTVQDWVRDTYRRLNEEPLGKAVYGSVSEFWVGGLRRTGQVWNYGEHIFERDWDVLLVLDTCRWDVLAEVNDEYAFLGDYDPETDYMNSLGSRSPEWVDETFNNADYKDELANTAYLTANPHSEDINNPEELQLLDEVWKYEWEPELGVVPPEPLTDRAINVMREENPDHLIVHYMQPHQPYRSLAKEKPEWFGVVGDEESWRPNNDSDGLEASHKTIWDRLRYGEIDGDKLWDAYRDNLRWVLDSIEMIPENMDAEEIVITADHGESFGEWGCYGHRSHIPIKELKRVPWQTFSGTDTGKYEATVAPPEDTSVTNQEVEDRLRSLGYK